MSEEKEITQEIIPNEENTSPVSPVETEEERYKRSMAALDKQINSAKQAYIDRFAFVRDFRADLRGIENAIKSIEISDCLIEAKNRTVEARMWTGKLLGCIENICPFKEIVDGNPYKNADGTDKTEVVPAADPSKEPIAWKEGNTTTQNVQELRTMIEHLIEKFKSNPPFTPDPMEAWYGTYVGQKLIEARMWLGESLSK